VRAWCLCLSEPGRAPKLSASRALSAPGRTLSPSSPPPRGKAGHGPRPATSHRPAGRGGARGLIPLRIMASTWNGKKRRTRSRFGRGFQSLIESLNLPPLSLALQLSCTCCLFPPVFFFDLLLLRCVFLLSASPVVRLFVGARRCCCVTQESRWGWATEFLQSCFAPSYMLTELGAYVLCIWPNSRGTWRPAVRRKRNMLGAGVSVV
jgi:hypothetical protein